MLKQFVRELCVDDLNVFVKGHLLNQPRLHLREHQPGFDGKVLADRDLGIDLRLAQRPVEPRNACCDVALHPLLVQLV
jgi:hypothetical protein